MWLGGPGSGTVDDPYQEIVVKSLLRQKQTRLEIGDTWRHLLESGDGRGDGERRSLRHRLTTKSNRRELRARRRPRERELGSEQKRTTDVADSSIIIPVALSDRAVAPRGRSFSRFLDHYCWRPLALWPSAQAAAAGGRWSPATCMIPSSDGVGCDAIDGSGRVGANWRRFFWME